MSKTNTLFLLNVSETYIFIHFYILNFVSTAFAGLPRSGKHNNFSKSDKSRNFVKGQGKS